MDVEEQALRSRILHTAFDPQVVKAFPGTLSHQAMTASMKAQLPALPANHGVWACTAEWDPDDLRLLQTFWIHRKLRGHEEIECGPDWAMQKRRAQVVA